MRSVRRADDLAGPVLRSFLGEARMVPKPERSAPSSASSRLRLMARGAAVAAGEELVMMDVASEEGVLVEAYR